MLDKIRPFVRELQQENLISDSL